MYFLLVGSHYVLCNELWAENVKSDFRGHVLGDSSDSVVKDGCISSLFSLCGGSLVEGRLKMAVRETKCALILNYLRLLPA